MAALATDNFDRTNISPIDGNWATKTGQSAMAIVSNKAQYSDRTTDCASRNTAVTWPNDQYSQAAISTTCTAVSAGNGIGVACRMASAADSDYEAITAGLTAHTELSKRVAGVYTNIAGSSTDFAANDIIYIEAQGTALKVNKNGANLISTTDSALASGSAGIFFSSEAGTMVGNPDLDNWEGGDFSAGGIVSSTRRFPANTFPLTLGVPTKFGPVQLFKPGIPFTTPTEEPLNALLFDDFDDTDDVDLFITNDVVPPVIVDEQQFELGIIFEELTEVDDLTVNNDLETEPGIAYVVSEYVEEEEDSSSVSETLTFDDEALTAFIDQVEDQDEPPDSTIMFLDEPPVVVADNAESDPGATQDEPQEEIETGIVTEASVADADEPAADVGVFYDEGEEYTVTTIEFVDLDATPPANADEALVLILDWFEEEEIQVLSTDVLLIEDTPVVVVETAGQRLFLVNVGKMMNQP